MKDEPIFTMLLNKRDAEHIINVVNQGIDSRLEAFTQSKFTWLEVGRLSCNIANYNELQILIRRLLESNNDYAMQLADDIVYAKFGYETI